MGKTMEKCFCMGKTIKLWWNLFYHVESPSEVAESRLTHPHHPYARPAPPHPRVLNRASVKRNDLWNSCQPQNPPPPVCVCIRALSVKHHPAGRRRRWIGRISLQHRQKPPSATALACVICRCQNSGFICPHLPDWLFSGVRTFQSWNIIQQCLSLYAIRSARGGNRLCSCLFNPEIASKYDDAFA